MKNRNDVNKIKYSKNDLGYGVSAMIENNAGLNILAYSQRSSQWKASMITSALLLLTSVSANGASTFPSNLFVEPQSRGSIVWTGSPEKSNGQALRGLTAGQLSSFGGMYFNCVSSYGCNGWATVDGYVGIPIADNILIVLQGSGYSSAAGEGITVSRGYGWTIRYNLNHQSIPVMTKSGDANQNSWNPTMTTSIVTPPGTSGPHLYIQPTPRPNSDPDGTSRFSFMNDWDITPALYVGKRAKGGTYTLPNSLYASVLGIDGRYPYPMSAPNYLLAGGSVTVADFSCTVSAPPTIDFGTVNLWNFAGNSTGAPGGARKDVLASVDGNLSISCESDTPEATSTAELTLKGTTQTYSNDLQVTMDNTGNPAPATVRASIKDIESPCSTNGLHFSSSTSGDTNKVSIGKLGVGQKNIPYRFSLCSRPEAGINQFGRASARATITLDWD